MNVLVLDTSREYCSVFVREGHTCDILTEQKELYHYDLVCLVGGADVDPRYYNEPKDPRTYSTPDQDSMVFDYLTQTQALSMPVVGICKGAQQLCVFNGGKLHQHVNGHNQGHDIVVSDSGEMFYTRGGHHQMMHPAGTEHELVAYSDNISGEILFEPEVVYFPKNNGLAVQYHPEWMDKESRGSKFFWECIERYLL